MRSVLFFLFCWVVAAKGDDEYKLLPDDTHKDVEDRYEERGGNPKGMRIKGEDVIEHDQDHQDSPIRLYYIVDPHGKKRSDFVMPAVLPLFHDDITFQWLDQQKYLVVINNRHKMFYVRAYARNSKGRYEEIQSDINDDKIMGKTVHFILAKKHPERTAEEQEEAEEGENVYVDTDALNVSEAGMDVPVRRSVRGGDIDILYRFDCKTRRLFRKAVFMPLDMEGKRNFTVSNEELEKALEEPAKKGGKKKRGSGQ